MLKNPYVRVALSAGLSTLISPNIINRLMVPEMSTADGIRNDAVTFGVSGATAAFLYVVFSMTLGAPTQGGTP